MEVERKIESTTEENEAGKREAINRLGVFDRMSDAMGEGKNLSDLEKHREAKLALIEARELRQESQEKITAMKDELQIMENNLKNSDLSNQEMMLLFRQKSQMAAQLSAEEFVLKDIEVTLIPAVQARAEKRKAIAKEIIVGIVLAENKKINLVAQEKIAEVDELISGFYGAARELYRSEEVRFDLDNPFYIRIQQVSDRLRRAVAFAMIKK